MNDSRHTPDDEQFARNLEQAHDRLISESTGDNIDNASQDPRVDSAVRVLELLEKIKPEHNQPVAAETVDQIVGQETPNVNDRRNVVASDAIRH